MKQFFVSQNSQLPVGVRVVASAQLQGGFLIRRNLHGSLQRTGSVFVFRMRLKALLIPKPLQFSDSTLSYIEWLKPGGKLGDDAFPFR